MVYEAQNIDTKKALEHLREIMIDSQTLEAREREKIQKYYEGYRAGIQRAMDIFYCKNYEKDIEKEG